MSDELRKIAREYWDDLKAHVDEKELKRSDVWSTKHGPNVQALVDEGIVRFESDGSAVFPAGKGGVEQLRKFFDALERDQELDKK